MTELPEPPETRMIGSIVDPRRATRFRLQGHQVNQVLSAVLHKVDSAVWARVWHKISIPVEFRSRNQVLFQIEEIIARTE